MARTTAAEVREIMEPTITITDPHIDAYIIGANALVTNALGTDTTLGDTLKEEIERWLTAHMIVSTRERMGAKEAAGTAKIEYTGKWGEALHSTSYGQIVLTLDTTGKLKTLTDSKSATLTAITSFT